MSVTLEEARGHTLRVNAWNWGVLCHAVSCATPPILGDAAMLEHLRAGCGLILSAPEIAALHRYLKHEILPQFSSGQRLCADLSVTDEADDGIFHRDDLSKNYSLSHKVLLAVVQFLQTAQAPLEVW